VNTRQVTYSLLIAALLGCHHTKDDPPHSVEPVRYRGPAVPSISMPPRSTTTGALVGAVYDCGGHPLAAVLLSARRYGVDSVRAADSLAQLVDSTFATRSLRPGRWELIFRAIGYTTRSIPVTITSGAIDTLMVQLSESPMAIGDCVCANGDFGSQCCKPVTTRACDLPELPTYVCGPGLRGLTSACSRRRGGSKET
jgi:hypothetical protein